MTSAVTLVIQTFGILGLMASSFAQVRLRAINLHTYDMRRDHLIVKHYTAVCIQISRHVIQARVTVFRDQIVHVYNVAHGLTLA